MNHDRLLTVTAAIALSNGKILLARRKPGESLAGHWEFPGGKLEPGEEIEACLKREIREEFGIEVTVGQRIAECVYRYESGPIKLVAFLIYIAAPETDRLKPSVHDRIAWVKPADLPMYRLSPADIPIAEAVARRLVKEEIN